MILSAVVMASGKSERFGENKLTAKLCGKKLIRYTLDSLPTELFAEIIVVTKYPQVKQLEKIYHAPFKFIFTDDPDGGQDSTIRFGTRQLSPDSDGCMFIAADQPLKRKSSLTRQIALFEEYWSKGENKFVALGFEGKRGNPVIFPKSAYPELKALTEGQTGSAVLRRHKDELIISAAETDLEMLDVDSKEDMIMLEKMMAEDNLDFFVCRGSKGNCD